MIKKNKKKLAFVIGGNGSIGTDIVKKFIQNNIRVLVLDLKIQKKLSKKIDQEIFDLSKVDKIENRLLKLIKKYGCPDILINTAYPISKNWKKINFNFLTLEDLKDNVHIHLNSTTWSTLVIANQMKKNKINGSIIFINSIYGVLAQDNNTYKDTNISSNPLYSIIKGGLVNFSKNLASYYGQFGIRSNSIISGGIEGKIAGTKEIQSTRFKNKYIKKTLLKRMARVEDISSAALFLSTKDSAYITGTEVYVDGGYASI